ncbi:MAG: aldehyde dehydrogenase family protein [Bacillus sp. (in: firmicutes)]
MKKTVLQAISPSTKERIGLWEETGADEIAIIMKQARNAFPSWSSLSIEERFTYFRKLKDAILESLQETSEVISKDAGKVPVDALVADIMPVLDFLKGLEKEAVKVLHPKKTKTPLVLIGKKSRIEYMPRGAVVIISPWNYPFQLAMVPVLSALISGNTVISKPSEVTPMVGMAMEELFKKAGFPEGVVQFVHGGKEAGEALVASKPDYIFFTGSVATGKIIGAQAMKDLIPVTLELGGKDPMIVCEDAHLERAAKGAAWGAFTNSGQVCMSVERLYVHENVCDRFLSLLKEEVAGLRQGTDVDDDIGSMTFPKQLDTVKEHVNEALQKGAVLEHGSAPSEWEDDSMFLKPIILTNVRDDMAIIREETFGPVLPIIPFRTDEEAIEKANSTAYGLNASVWSADSDRAGRIASRLVSGAVVINDVLISVANHHLPFGGAKQSGIGRYHGEEGLKIFCHQKAIMSDSGKKATELPWYPYKGKYGHFFSLIQSYYGKPVKWGSFIASFMAILKAGKK